MGNEYIAEDNLKIYTPDIGDSESIGLDETETSYSPRLNKIKEGEIIQVQLNEKAIKWRISHDLYKDFKSGVRELFQNEARACRQARDKYNAKPKIEVRINPVTKSFSIQGIDSLGISEAVFDKVLRVLGVSGNTDGGNEVGQFGMGFASYTTMSDIILVETWYRENYADGTDHTYAFLGDNGIDFKILPKPENLETYGTKMSMTYHAKVEERGIIDMLTECAKFCSIPVTLIVDNQWNSYHEYGQEGIYELTIYDGLEDCLRQQYKKKLETQGDDKTIGFYKEVHIDNEDYEFFGIIAIEENKENNYTHKFNGEMNYHLLATVPIEIGFSTKGFWTSYALNIKNERKFMPTADRDRLTQEAEEEIQKAFDNSIPAYFDEYHLNTIEDFKQTNDKALYSEYYYFEPYINHEKFEATQLILSTLDKRFNAGGTRSHKSLKQMMASGKTMVKLKALRGDYIARLGTVFDDMVVFRFKESDQRNEDDYSKTLDLLKEAGVIFGEDYIKEHKIRSLTKKERNTGNKVANAEKAIRLYNGSYRATRTWEADNAGEDVPFGMATGWRRALISTKVGQVNEKQHDNMIVFDGKKTDDIQFDWVKNQLYNEEASYILMKNIKGLDEDIVRWSDYLDDVKQMEFTYVSGDKVKASELPEAYNVIMGNRKAIHDLSNGKVVEGYEKCIVVENVNGMFDLAVASKIYNVSKNYGDCSETDLIQKASGVDVDDITMYCNETTKKQIYSKLPAIKNNISSPLFELFFRAVASKPHDFDKLLSLLKEEVGEFEE